MRTRPCVLRSHRGGGGGKQIPQKRGGLGSSPLLQPRTRLGGERAGGVSCHGDHKSPKSKNTHLEAEMNLLFPKRNNILEAVSQPKNKLIVGTQAIY